MLTSQKTDDAGLPFCNKSQNGNHTIISVPTGDRPIEDLLDKEWLLTNNRGGYASSTIVGCNTRRYHGLLIGSLNPPANRIMALAKCLEMVISEGRVFNLSTFEFSDKFAPERFSYIKQFRQDTGAHFDYQLDKFELTKSVYLLRDTDTVALVYDFMRVEGPAEFVLRPFVGLRDFHTLQKSYAHVYSTWLSNGLMIRHDMPESCELFLSCPSANFEKDEQWWFNFVYRNDKQRGQDFTEDLWTPGLFRCRVDSPTKIVFWAKLAGSGQRTADTLNAERSTLNAELDIDEVRKDLRSHQESVKRKAKAPVVLPDVCLPMSFGKSLKRNTRYSTGRPMAEIRDTPQDAQRRRYEILCLAADQFIVTPLPLARGKEGGARTTSHPSSVASFSVADTAKDELRRPDESRRVTVLAGFPWFADWGRDTFVALPGLLLLTGRFDEAKSVLTTFAQAADEGMIPNRFDDNGNTAYFNSIDASLWFINAAFQYLNTVSDSETFTQQLLPTIRCIIDSYHNGTRFGICADADGLITAGDYETQLTWMDAKYDGVAFTPRYGKAVEVNALWYNALCWLARYYSSRLVRDASCEEERTQYAIRNTQYKIMADKVAASFRELFWNEKCGYLNDCILPDGSVDAALRPNQIFAVSLPFSPLSSQQQKSVVDVVQKNLLTPYGLRTLNVQDSRYKGTYTGPQQQRDEAYHQGTVWPYLIGPFVASYLKVNGFSRKSKRKAAEFIQPLMQHLTENGCLGQLCEIFDGDAPYQPRGCIAQAWSVAELIRAFLLTSPSAVSSGQSNC